MAEFIATISAGIWAGAAFYISFAEHPSALKVGVAFATEYFRPMSKRTAPMMMLLAALCGGTSIYAWYSGAEVSWLLGGVLMLAAMASTLPAPAVIPTHGVIQLGSNVGRAIIMRHWIHWPVLAWFAAGALLGAGLGAWLFVALPQAVLQLILGGFILYSVWGPKLARMRVADRAFAAVGVVTTFITEAGLRATRAFSVSNGALSARSCTYTLRPSVFSLCFARTLRTGAGRSVSGAA